MIVATEKDSVGIMTNIVVRYPNTVSPPSNRSRNQRQSKSNGQVRIVAGQWRGTKLAVPDVNGLRPPGDRVRETLFNWLQADIAGSHCLDLFAGSGALGIESLSRYAASATFVEPNKLAASRIRSTLEALKQSPTIEIATAEAYLAGSTDRFDIVFIDPPFDAQSQLATMKLLLKGHLAERALVYVEAPTQQNFPSQWPQGYHIQREKQFGDVMARLFRVDDVA